MKCAVVQRTVVTVFKVEGISQMPGGLREVRCVLDGKRVEPFIVYPDAIKMFPEKSRFLAYLERSAKNVVSISARGNSAHRVQ